MSLVEWKQPQKRTFKSDRPALVEREPAFLEETVQRVPEIFWMSFGTPKPFRYKACLRIEPSRSQTA